MEGIMKTIKFMSKALCIIALLGFGVTAEATPDNMKRYNKAAAQYKSKGAIKQMKVIKRALRKSGMRNFIPIVKRALSTTDTDGDGVYDGLEPVLGTSVCDDDTDGDSYSDGYEADEGCDPTTADIVCDDDDDSSDDDSSDDDSSDDDLDDDSSDDDLDDDSSDDDLDDDSSDDDLDDDDDSTES